MTAEKTSEQQQIVYVPAQYPPYEEEDEIDLLELWGVLWQGRWFIGLLALLSTLTAVFVSLQMTDIYKSTAVLQPTESQQGGLGKLAGLAANLPIPVNLPGGEGKSQSIMAFLESRNIQERLITRYDLLPRLYPDQWEPETGQWMVEDPDERPTLAKALQRNAVAKKMETSQNDKNGLITVGWESDDPVFAKSMVERIINEAKDYLENEYETDAQREREFVELQLAKAKQELEYWERQVPSQQVPQAEIQRELLAAQTVYAELRKQLELARIAESKEVVRFKLLDSPFVPVDKSEPKRSMICALTLVASIFLAIFLVFFRQFLVNARKKCSEGGGR